MEYFEIIGQKKLKGSIDVRGSKNAATPVLAATLLTKDECVLTNLPLIEDVFRMVEILESMGAKIEWIKKRTLKIKNDKIDPAKMDLHAVRKMRSSILLFGSLSARFPKFKMPCPGGCVIGARPMDTHFDALYKLGVDVVEKDGFFQVSAQKRKSGPVVLKEFSVTGTENALMLASSLPGKTTIKIAAAEPHVQNLCELLVKMGAKITGIGSHTLEITGAKKLRGAKHEIIPDFNEAATFLILGVATRSPITVNNAVEKHLDLVLEKLKEFGADFKIKGSSIQVVPAKKLVSIKKVETRTYPGIPTDVQSLFGVLATQAQGDTFIFDTLYEGRFNYVSELEKMGARATVLNPHQMLIHGPAHLQGTTIKSFDLRAGAALIIAALSAKGKTIIHDAYQVDRGYERIEERLMKLGADIKRVKDECKK
jgi:UDP-N-acetylglucosamine 1-carboxyvinyltransferase